ncbi:hypothetical protein HPB51_012071 [Rhipicephalus microplus]|uniref:Uncharacterized protein n=1 Tax=Rhipicephalus microplus TaxID=6941 RepID=A0A9J6EHA5_RHIMP|nr:hypothetical protein HPB51_012071 [Rhipicephalus microplus]
MIAGQYLKGQCISKLAEGKEEIEDKRKLPGSYEAELWKCLCGRPRKRRRRTRSRASDRWWQVTTGGGWAPRKWKSEDRCVGPKRADQELAKGHAGPRAVLGGIRGVLTEGLVLACGPDVDSSWDMRSRTLSVELLLSVLWESRSGSRGTCLGLATPCAAPATSACATGTTGSSSPPPPVKAESRLRTWGLTEALSPAVTACTTCVPEFAMDKGHHRVLTVTSSGCCFNQL